MSERGAVGDMYNILLNLGSLFNLAGRLAGGLVPYQSSWHIIGVGTLLVYYWYTIDIGNTSVCVYYWYWYCTRADNYK